MDLLEEWTKINKEKKNDRGTEKTNFIPIFLCFVHEHVAEILSDGPSSEPKRSKD